MQWIRISSASTVEPAALEILGATDKSSDKIGRFGSGVKYALIQALRNKVPVRIHCGWWSCEFDTKPIKIGTKTFERVIYKYSTTKQEAHVHESSFSLNAASEWRQAWFIIREFWANALDEDDGATIELVDEPVGPDVDRTDVYLGYTEYLQQAFDEREHWDARVSRVPVEGSQGPAGCLYEPTCCEGLHVYHKGILVYFAAGKKRLYDYDVTRCEELNEVRLLDSEWKVHSSCSNVVDDANNEDLRRGLLKHLLEEPDTKIYEQELRFNSHTGKSWYQLLQEEVPNPVLIRRSIRNREKIVGELLKRGYSIVEKLPSNLCTELESEGIPTPHSVLTVDKFSDVDVAKMDQARIKKAEEILNGVYGDSTWPIIVVKNKKDWDFMYGPNDKILALELGDGILQQGTPAVLRAIFEARMESQTSRYSEDRVKSLVDIAVESLTEAHHARTGEIIG